MGSTNNDLVKVVVDGNARALYFSRAPIPFPRDGAPEGEIGLAHMGLYVYRREFLMRYSSLPESLLEGRET